MVVKISVEKMSLKNFQMSEQNWGCLDKMSEVNFSPAETLPSNNYRQLIFTAMLLFDTDSLLRFTKLVKCIPEF